MDDYARWMQRALALAEHGRGAVEPNPLVGAVLVRDDTELGAGYHARFGGMHAEVAALQAAQAAGHEPKGATMVVTLEPCAHQGKQPACVDALIEAQVQRVVVAMTDPFPEVAGRGLAKLREAGIEVISDVEAAAASWQNRAFLKRIEHGLPWIIGKWAQTVDGKIATRTGDSQWISGPAARQRVHQWRGEVDDILVGPGTFAQDDPQLTARQTPAQRTARRVVIAPDPQTLTQSTMLTTPGPPVTLALDQEQAATMRQWAKQHAACAVEVVELAPQPNSTRLALYPLMRQLAQTHEASNVLVEGGGGLMGALRMEGLLDELRVFVAPRLLGDAQAVDAVSGLSPSTIDAATSLSLQYHELIEHDMLLTYRVD
jgi:diaminohydroxyphosphoribosylaminopyrimidine deaminase/5-amino-6-(5-phosphoribosylamino)uracil reductase